MENRKVSDVFFKIPLILSSSKGIDGLVGSMSEMIASDLGFRGCMIILKNNEGHFVISSLAGVERGKALGRLYMKCPENGIAFINHILMNNNTIIVDRLPESLSLSEEQAKAVVSPLLCKGRGIGVVIAEDLSVDYTDTQIIESVARYISMGIENHTLYREGMESHMDLIHEVETLHLMYEIGREIISNLKTDDIIETAIQMIRRIIPCDGAAVALLDHEKKSFSVIASWGSGMEKGTILDETDIPFPAVLESGKSFYQHDITLDFPDYPKQLQWASEKNVFSYFCVPLQVKRRFFGVLVMSSVRPAWFAKIHMMGAERLATQVGIALENARLLEGIEEIFMGTVRSLVSAIDAKSTWTRGHSLRVADYAVRIGEKLRFNKDALDKLRMAAILHDIGKIGTYEGILDKPGKLTSEEMDLIRRHPAQGAEILRPLGAMKDIIPIMKHHHERYDGTGYPDGLAGEDIPFEARILSIADVYDAMLSDRPYRNKRTPEEAIRELKTGAGTQFDPMLTALFLDILSDKQM